MFTTALFVMAKGKQSQGPIPVVFISIVTRIHIKKPPKLQTQ